MLTIKRLEVIDETKTSEEADETLHFPNLFTMVVSDSENNETYVEVSQKTYSVLTNLLRDTSSNNRRVA